MPRTRRKPLLGQRSAEELPLEGERLFPQRVLDAFLELGGEDPPDDVST
jgi:hypothetical protein